MTFFAFRFPRHFFLAPSLSVFLLPARDGSRVPRRVDGASAPNPSRAGFSHFSSEVTAHRGANSASKVSSCGGGRTALVPSGLVSQPNESMKLIIAVSIGVVLGYFIGVSLPAVNIVKHHLPRSIITWTEEDSPSLDTLTSGHDHSGNNTRPHSNNSLSHSHNNTRLHSTDNLEVLLYFHVKLTTRSFLRNLAGALTPVFRHVPRRNHSTLSHAFCLRILCLPGLSLPCHAMNRFVEIMAPVFSRDAWRCVWHMIQVRQSISITLHSSWSLSQLKCNYWLLSQNDLVHGWGLDFALRRCVEVLDGKGENEKIARQGV
ncbi:hypothetical protein BHE74_00045304 [Ensete ventricosum]|nr:hypothetical protein GW17_00002851 [Ensete ventricosum]RWW48610.1 hypothetical protein BHE74_00045304 [Ensete ventricosum]